MAAATGRLIIVCGLPGSGKSTLSRQRADETGATIFSPDDWLRRLGLDLYDERRRDAIEQVQWGVAQELIRLGGTVIIEWGTWARSERDTLRLGARALGAAVELVYLNASLDVLYDRISSRDRETPPITRDMVRGWFETFEAPTPEEFALFDPPQRNPA